MSQTNLRVDHSIQFLRLFLIGTAVLSLAYMYGNPNRPPVEQEYEAVKAENDWTSAQVAKPAPGSRPAGRIGARSEALAGYAFVGIPMILFFVLIGFVFWITSLHDRPDFARKPEPLAPAPDPAEAS